MKKLIILLAVLLLCFLSHANAGLVNVAATENGGVASAGSTGTWPSGYTRHAYYAIDGDSNTTWANQWTIPTWFQVQFDQDYLIEKLAVSWSQADYISSIYLSQDSSNWTEIVPSRRSTANAYDTFIIQPTLARYAKVEFTGSYAPSNWIFQAEIREFEAYAVPEPATLSLFALGGLVLRKRRKA